ncbi:unnamed protein product [Caenorhabditis sp. 36 PRJEB53466]|nr:unnamed protein product [Caenorhabditis sp. 36 PRJEB53466]
MECFHNDVDNDFSTIRKHNSELDICLDSVVNKASSASRVSVNTALSVETVEPNLNADADPSLGTRISFSTASEISENEPSKTIDDYCSSVLRMPPKVWKNERGVLRFEMIADGQKVVVLDSLECMQRLESSTLEPVFFDSRLYLGVSDSVDLEYEDSEDVRTADLGPSFSQFPQFLSEMKEKQ